MIRHNRESIRLKGYDYSSDGCYFVTVCTFKRFLILGEIVGGKMFLNENGLIVSEELLKTGQIRKNVELNDFVIMPNHVHLVLTIKNINKVGAYCPEKVGAYYPEKVGAYYPEKVGAYYPEKVGAYCNTPLQKKLISPKNNLGSIIRGIKSATSKRIQETKNNRFLVWQRNYYEIIIRNERGYLRIKEYIRLNPIIWDKDRG